MHSQSHNHRCPPSHQSVSRLFDIHCLCTVYYTLPQSWVPPSYQSLCPPSLRYSLLVYKYIYTHTIMGATQLSIIIIMYTLDLMNNSFPLIASGAESLLDPKRIAQSILQKSIIHLFCNVKEYYQFTCFVIPRGAQHYQFPPAGCNRSREGTNQVSVHN